MFSGICPVCKKSFESKYAKTYCGHKCWVTTEEFKEVIRKGLESRKARLQRENKSWLQFECAKCGKPFRRRACTARKEGLYNQFCSRECYRTSDVIGRLGKTPKVVTNCKQCGKEVLRTPGEAAKRRFCNYLCWREFFSQRFDRWTATQHSIPMLENYDEFMLQEELPCLIDGCSWVGRHLGIHVNHTHGISADDFKAMVGFNRTTGLVCPDAFKTLSEAHRGQGFPEGFGYKEGMNVGTFERRKETIEHYKKVMATYRAEKEQVQKEWVDAKESNED